MDTATSSGKWKHTPLIFILCMLILGTGLRLYHLDSEDIWLDEAISINYNTTGSFAEIFHYVAKTDSNPPLYFIVLHYWLNIGKDAFTIRLLSALFGILSIPIFYLLAKRLFSETTALISTLFWVLSPYHLWYCQEARMYSLLVLLILCSTYFLVRITQSQPDSKINWFFYILFSVTALYTHYFMLFILVSQGTFIWLENRYNQDTKHPLFKKWIYSQLIIFLLCSPLIGLVYAQHFRTNTEWIPTLKIQDIVGTPFHLLLGANISLNPLAVAITIVLFSILIVTAFMKNFNHWFTKDILGNTLILAWLFLPIFLFLCISIFKPVYVVDRYLIICLPAFLLLLGSWLDYYFVSIKKWMMVGFFAIALSLSLGSYYKQEKKIPFHIPSLMMANEIQSGDALVFLPAWQYPGFQHYFRGAAPGYPNTNIPSYFYPGHVYQMWEQNTARPVRMWEMSVGGDIPEMSHFLSSRYSDKQIKWQYSNPRTPPVELVLYERLKENN